MKQIWKQLKSKKGMTLIEVLIAAAILGVAGLILFMGVSAMAGIAIESTTMSNMQAAISEKIATGLENETLITGEYEDGAFALSGGVIITGRFVTYQTESGENFTVFEADGTTGG